MGHGKTYRKGEQKELHEKEAERLGAIVTQQNFQVRTDRSLEASGLHRVGMQLRRYLQKNEELGQ